MLNSKIFFDHNTEQRKIAHCNIVSFTRFVYPMIPLAQPPRLIPCSVSSQIRWSGSLLILEDPNTSLHNRPFILNCFKRFGNPNKWSKTPEQPRPFQLWSAFRAKREHYGVGDANRKATSSVTAPRRTNTLTSLSTSVKLKRLSWY